jgi:hypothetical protein
MRTSCLPTCLSRYLPSIGSAQCYRDPHGFQCGFGSRSSFSISMRIRIRGAKPKRIHADLDPDPGQTSKSQKLNFCIKIFVKYLRRYRSLFKPVFYINFGKFPCSWIRIRIRIPNTDPDPGHPTQCGSMRIRIPNTLLQ